MYTYSCAYIIFIYPNQSLPLYGVLAAVVKGLGLLCRRNRWPVCIYMYIYIYIYLDILNPIGTIVKPLVFTSIAQEQQHNHWFCVESNRNQCETNAFDVNLIETITTPIVLC